MKSRSKSEVETTVEFWKRVHRSETSKCWVWNGSKRKTWSGPYGHFTKAKPGGVGIVCVEAHRFSYELLVGEIPTGLVIDHLCRNTLCVNPAHLEAVTTAENVMRGNGASALNARKTHCKRGHPLDGENLTKRYDGARGCNICKKISNDRANRKQTELEQKLRLELPYLVAFWMLINQRNS